MHDGPVPVNGSLHGSTDALAVESGFGVVVDVVLGAGIGGVVRVSGHVWHVVLFHSQRFSLSSQYNPPGAQGRLSYKIPLEQVANTWHPLHD